MTTNLLSVGWVAVGLLGLVFALLVLRENLADRRAAIIGRASEPARMFMRENLRGTWFRVSKLASITLAAVFPLIWPAGSPGRPAWVRGVTIGLLILLEVLLTVDAGLALRHKRQFLARFGGPDREDGDGRGPTRKG